MANDSAGPSDTGSDQKPTAAGTDAEQSDSAPQADTPPTPKKRTARQITNQAADCLGLLLPPLALAKAAVEAGISGLRRNVPETIADLTGGEYYTFKNPKTISRDLEAIANHVPNRYILSFQPKSPHPGLHALSVHLKNYNNVEILARTSYWADSEAPSKP